MSLSDPLSLFLKHLKGYFNEEYTQDEVESALHVIETNHLESIYNEEREAVALVKEDFILESINTQAYAT